MAQKAVFDHVDDDGVVILRIGDEKVELDDSDDFEQGLLAAKQIKAEARTDTLPPETAGLPISQIQNLARAGVTTDKIAAKYGMDPALIRRFAEPIEQEKKTSPSSSPSTSVRTRRSTGSASFINSTLVAAGVDTASVEWTASRNRREPWRISALFPHNSRIYSATWSWNMRDNARSSPSTRPPRNCSASRMPMRATCSSATREHVDSTDVPQSARPNSPRESRMIEGGHRHGEDSRSAQNDAGEDDTPPFRPFAGEGSHPRDPTNRRRRHGPSPLHGIAQVSCRTGPQTGGTLDRAGQTHADANSLRSLGDHQQEETAHQPSAVTNGPHTTDRTALTTRSPILPIPLIPPGRMGRTAIRTVRTDMLALVKPDRPSRQKQQIEDAPQRHPFMDDIIFGD